mmetsp:Transcript_119710/g.350077  ORF Transcript_119710/g.350077 Transcript_119710/m.350077 type:complete len:419 (-) Transcript_119710:217-1473(-)
MMAQAGATKLPNWLLMSVAKATNHERLPNSSLGGAGATLSHSPLSSSRHSWLTSSSSLFILSISTVGTRRSGSSLDHLRRCTADCARDPSELMSEWTASSAHSAVSSLLSRRTISLELFVLEVSELNQPGMFGRRRALVPCVVFEKDQRESCLVWLECHPSSPVGGEVYRGSHRCCESASCTHVCVFSCELQEFSPSSSGGRRPPVRKSSPSNGGLRTPSSQQSFLLKRVGGFAPAPSSPSLVSAPIKQALLQTSWGGGVRFLKPLFCRAAGPVRKQGVLDVCDCGKEAWVGKGRLPSLRVWPGCNWMGTVVPSAWHPFSTKILWGRSSRSSWEQRWNSSLTARLTSSRSAAWRPPRSSAPRTSFLSAAWSPPRSSAPRISEMFLAACSQTVRTVSSFGISQTESSFPSSSSSSKIWS